MNAKLFADDTSLFSVIDDSQTSANAPNKDLEIIHNWDFQLKINFNTGPTKQAQEVTFSCKIKNLPHPPLVFNNANVTQSVYQKHPDIILDSKLTIENHIKMLTTKISKAIGFLRKIQNLLPRTALKAISKVFLRPHLDYGDIPYDKAFNLSFQQKLESGQYRACLAITGAIRCTSRENIYQELGLESLQSRRWYRKLTMFYKIYKNKSPFYLFNLIPEKNIFLYCEKC